MTQLKLCVNRNSWNCVDLSFFMIFSLLTYFICFFHLLLFMANCVSSCFELNVFVIVPAVHSTSFITLPFSMENQATLPRRCYHNAINKLILYRNVTLHCDRCKKKNYVYIHWWLIIRSFVVKPIVCLLQHDVCLVLCPGARYVKSVLWVA